MGDRLGTVGNARENDEVSTGGTIGQTQNYSEEVAAAIDEEVKAIVDRAYARCEAILTEKRPQLELTARYLLDHETMEADVFAKVFTDPGAEEFAPYRQQKD